MGQEVHFLAEKNLLACDVHLLRDGKTCQLRFVDILSGI